MSEILTEEKAREILKDYIRPDGGLDSVSEYMSWTPGDKTITLDGEFEIEEMEAIAWWIRNTSNTKHTGLSADGEDREGWI